MVGVLKALKLVGEWISGEWISGVHCTYIHTYIHMSVCLSYHYPLIPPGVTISVDAMIQVVEGQTGDIELNITEGTLGRTLLVNATSMSGVATGKE